MANDLNVTFVQVDVSDQVAVDRLFDTAFELHGGVDIAFNNAGISRPTTTSSRTPASTPGTGCRTST